MENHGLKKIWRKDGHDFIADIGNMKKAIVIALYLGGRYKISPRSFFPFKDSDYEIVFTDYTNACNYSESCIRDWVQSLFYESEKLQDEKYKKINL
jgi:hypothetical protein